MACITDVDALIDSNCALFNGWNRLGYVEYLGSMWNGNAPNPMTHPVAAAEHAMWNRRAMDLAAGASLPGGPYSLPSAPKSGPDPRRAIHNSPETPRKIAELASNLIHSRPGDTVPVIVEAQTTTRSVKHGLIEIERAWPIGNFTYTDRRDTRSLPLPTAVTSDGKYVVLKYDFVTEGLDQSCVWNEPWVTPSSYPPNTTWWRAVVLDQLDRAQASHPSNATQHTETPVLGKPLTSRSLQKAFKYEREIASINREINKYMRLYGTKEEHTQLTVTSRQRKVWLANDKRRKRILQLQEQWSSVTGRPWSNAP